MSVLAGVAVDWEGMEGYIRALLLKDVSDPDELDDLTQECLILVWRRLESFEGRSAFRSWVYRLTRNRYLTWVRARESRRRLEGVAASMQPDHRPSVESAVLADVTAQSMLGRVDPVLRSALHLVCYEGHSYTEAAKRLGFADSSIRARLSKLRRQTRLAATPDVQANAA